jgi:hypothetical protein
MKIKLEAIYHAEDDGEPYIKMDMLSKNKLSIRFRLWWLLCKWRQTKLTLTITIKEAGKRL